MRNLPIGAQLYKQRGHQRVANHVMFLALLGVLVLSSACTSATGGAGQQDFQPNGNASEKILACKATDRQISSSSQCLQDDAACYQISNGQWCTGERGNVCPSGSTPIAAGTTCPDGARCFRFSESLECKI